jgi:hypothetical protein
MRVNYPVALVCTFVWIGFVCAISFMEAWLKFRAPGITLPLGLGIGRLVFAALNKVEWILMLGILLDFLLSGRRAMEGKQLLFLVPLVILLVQTVYALPALDARAELYVKGFPAPPSNLHFWYVAMEGVKVIFLLTAGISLLKRVRL